MILDDVRKDQELFNTNPEAYMRVRNRLDKILDERFKSVMGKEFNHEPLLTKEQLTMAIDNAVSRLKREHELKVPDIIIEHSRARLDYYQKQFENNQYAVTKPEFDYIENYNRRKQEYYDTQLGDYSEIITKLIQEEYPETAVV